MALANLLSQYFLNPLGLLGLLGLLPLLAFYFFRPEPEERVMPSMTFFMEEKKSGTIEKALEKLRKNLMLLLHILVIIGLAAAIADLYQEGKGRPETAVIVLDRSASMSDDMEEAKKFVKQNMGEENTLVVTGEDTQVPLEKASRSRMRNYLGSVEARDVKTDIASGLELASDYRGTLVVASDLDQTVSQRSAVQLLKDLGSDGRKIRLMETSNSNSWGIVGVQPGKHNTTVEVKNFRETRESVSVNVNGRDRQRVIGPDETETVTFSSSRLNRVRLEIDSLKADNTAYVSVPAERKFDVMLISDTGNRYLAKALELIEFTSVEQVQPPVERKLNADVYIVGRTESILPKTADSIEKQVRQGASLVVFGQKGLQKKGFSSVPEMGERRETTVEIFEPRNINVGGTEVHRLNRSRGESLAEPGDALVRWEHGRGEILLYNIRDEDFRFDFLYPVFWKGILAELTDRPSIQELNVATGETINESWVKPPGEKKVRGEVTATRSGFYNTSDQVYAANLASEEESDPEKPGIQHDQVSSSAADRKFRDLIILLLAGIAVSELVYLRRNGDL